MSTAFDSGVPVPPRAGKYTFSQMAIGDSRHFPLLEFIRARSSATHWKITHPGWDYVTRRDETGDGGRIWRTA